MQVVPFDCASACGQQSCMRYPYGTVAAALQPCFQGLYTRKNAVTCIADVCSLQVLVAGTDGPAFVPLYLSVLRPLAPGLRPSEVAGVAIFAAASAGWG